MRKKRSVHHKQYEHPIRWLPIDSRLITPIFQFGAVKGVSRLFLEIEITLTILIVSGTLFVAGIHIFKSFFR